jgi:hypothetical protein
MKLSLIKAPFSTKKRRVCSVIDLATWKEVQYFSKLKLVVYIEENIEEKVHDFCETLQDPGRYTYQ